ncbi:MAG: bactofilin family protein, partial [Spirochaetota bacterium]
VIYYKITVAYILKDLEFRMVEPKEIIEDENKIGTVIASDIKFIGTLKFKSSLKIKGSFQGKIETDGTLIIGDEATVSAEITAASVSISGKCLGKIKANKLVEIFEHSNMSGDIVTPDLYIENGAKFNGTCIMPK